MAAVMCIIVMMASSCGKQSAEDKRAGSDQTQPVEEQTEASPELNFENQYDLGMRFLSEGNYEEAVIAFTAALEIDPKRVDVYTALADTYEAMGDTEALRRILTQGIEATGDAGLEERLSVLPVQIPEMPEIWEGASGYYADNTYLIADEELESILNRVIEAGLAGDDVLADTAWNAQMAEEVCVYLREKGVVGVSGHAGIGALLDLDDMLWYSFWTKLSDGSVLRYRYRGYGSDPHFEWNHYEIVYRVENGKGFHFELRDYVNPVDVTYTYNLMQGEMAGYLFNGPFTRDYHGYGISGESHQQFTGTAVDDLVDGERVCVLYGSHSPGEEYYFTVYEVFEAGKRKPGWENDGEIYYQKTVYESGEIHYDVAYDGRDIDSERTTTAWGAVY